MSDTTRDGAPPLFTLHRGDTRLIVSIPHAGTYIPAAIAARLTPHARGNPDADWHVDRLYDFAAAEGATLLVASHARIVVDLNRDQAGTKLYPGQAETGICPAESFDGTPLYTAGPPDAAEEKARVDRYWRPYHAALAAELERIRSLHGEARLLDGHSIRQSVPRLFEGKLPDLNFGTHDGRAASAALVARVREATAGSGFSEVLDGRFKGGYITRQYGRPEAGIQAIQLEMAMTAYLDEDTPGIFQPARAAALQATLQRVVAALIRA